MSTSRASIEPMMPISLDEPDGGVAAEEVSAHETWCAAWRFAAELGNTMGRRAAATQTREKFQINFSASSAERAFAAKGELPCRPGKKLIIPSHIERKLEDLCLILREMKLPIFRFMVINRLIEDIVYAEACKKKEVKRDWYYRWLSRSMHLKTANLTPLEITRAHQWATVENVKKHYDMLAEILVQATIGMKNPYFDPEKPHDQRLFIVKPERLFSMDESRLTNDTTEKNKSNQNRSIAGKNDSREFLANKGGGDGTGIGGGGGGEGQLSRWQGYARHVHI